MNNMIAYCGLDCKRCEAFLATANNDDSLREEVAQKWSKMNQVEITKEMINCQGCRADGIKTFFCSNLCEIRQCAIGNQIDSCGDCKDLRSCPKLQMIIDHNPDAKERLTNKESRSVNTERPIE